MALRQVGRLRKPAPESHSLREASRSGLQSAPAPRDGCRLSERSVAEAQAFIKSCRLNAPCHASRQLPPSMMRTRWALSRAELGSAFCRHGEQGKRRPVTQRGAVRAETPCPALQLLGRGDTICNVKRGTSLCRKETHPVTWFQHVVQRPLAPSYPLRGKLAWKDKA